MRETPQANSSWKYGFIDAMGLRQYLTNKLAFRPPSPIGYSFEPIYDGQIQYAYKSSTRCQPEAVNSKSLVVAETYMVKRKDGCCPVIHIRRNDDFQSEGCIPSESQAGRSQSCFEIQQLIKKDSNLFKTQINDNREQKLLIIYSHGNASDLGDVYLFGEQVSIEYEVDFLCYDYSGYGITKGKYNPCEKLTYDDLQSVLVFAVCQLGYQLDQVILWGYSLGSGPTCEIASRFTQIGGVILQAPMASLYHWIDDHAPYQDGYANTKKIHSIRGPILILHGMDDKVIPIRHSELLYKSYIETNRNISPELVFVKIPNVGHHDMHDYLLDSLAEVGYQIYILLKQIVINMNHHRGNVVNKYDLRCPNQTKRESNASKERPYYSIYWRKKSNIHQNSLWTNPYIIIFSLLSYKKYQQINDMITECSQEINKYLRIHLHSFEYVLVVVKIDDRRNVSIWNEDFDKCQVSIIINKLIVLNQFYHFHHNLQYQMGSACRGCKSCEVHEEIMEVPHHDMNDNKEIKILDQQTKTGALVTYANAEEEQNRIEPASYRYFSEVEQRETMKQQLDMEQNDQVREKRLPFDFVSGAIYDGEWLGNMRDGQGTQEWPDNARYEGQWQLNKACGQGKFWHVDGDICDYYFYIKSDEGLWVDDKANGTGVYLHVNGAKYDGNWKNDLQDGYGVETWIDLSKYEGFYREGQKDGQGKYYWPDGSSYKGQWEQNRISGHGKYEWIDGREYEGEWLDNNMHGRGIYTWKDGRKYNGEYQNDKKHGQGSYTWTDGRRYEGTWVNGKQHGKGRYILPDGSIRSGLWEDGKRSRWDDETQ